MNTPKNSTILIIDDDRVSRLALAELLQNDHRILMAKDGETALKLAHSESINLILLDVSMPGMSGYDVLRRLKADALTEPIAVIFITSMIDPYSEEEGLLLGAADYILKPFHSAVVKARVNLHLKLAYQRAELERLSEVDALTGIGNRRYFDISIDTAVRQMTRLGQPLGLALIDVDFFKKYNDHYGHMAGDVALRKIAQTLQSVAQRAGDVAARYGGEEFVLILPQVTDLQQVLEEFRAKVTALAIPHAKSSVFDVVTISAGGVLFHPTIGLDPLSIIHQADQLLYQAKSQGRNQIIIQTI